VGIQHRWQLDRRENNLSYAQPRPGPFSSFLIIELLEEAPEPSLSIHLQYPVHLSLCLSQQLQEKGPKACSSPFSPLLLYPGEEGRREWQELF
jgi:hypothetical protein